MRATMMKSLNPQEEGEKEGVEVDDVGVVGGLLAFFFRPKTVTLMRSLRASTCFTSSSLSATKSRQISLRFSARCEFAARRRDETLARDIDWRIRSSHSAFSRGN
eukprot:GHVT01029422.1.p2 GENE.GHVT01029422.1~~GHVT01029422.1.p2  ORF type:complete len:105 (+),score=12.33 GHVT01029422.1:1320-1634(+)